MDVSWAAITLAFGAGMAAAVNPCGFALLPAYLGYFVGTDNEERSPAESALRSLGVSAVLTLGFVLVFAPFGFLTSALTSSVQEYLPYVTVGIGVLLLGLGIALLAGVEPTVKIPKLDKGGETRQFGSMLVFGVSYAVASLSCTLGPFLAVVGSSTAGSDVSVLSRLLTFTAYGVGMGALIMVLTVAVGFAKQGVVQRLRRVMPYVNRVSGAILVLVGLWIAWYGWYEIRLFILDGPVPDDPIVDRAFAIQESMSTFVNDNGSGIGWAALAMLVVVIGAAVASTRRSARAGEAQA